MTPRFHLFPFRTQKLSLVVPKILGWRRPGKIGRCRLFSFVMARWSSGQDGGLSRRKREFDSPTGHHYSERVFRQKIGAGGQSDETSLQNSTQYCFGHSSIARKRSDSRDAQAKLRFALPRVTTLNVFFRKGKGHIFLFSSVGRAADC